MQQNIHTVTLNYFQEWIKDGRGRGHPNRKKIFDLNEGLAGRAAQAAKAICPIPWDDLKQEACYGLLKAIDRFDPSCKKSNSNKSSAPKFSSFAMLFCEGAIKQMLRSRYGPLVRSPRKWHEEVSRIVGLSKKHGLTPLEVAIEEGHTKDEWERMQMSTARSSVGSVDSSENFDLAGSGSPSDNLEHASVNAMLALAIEAHCREMGDVGRVLKLKYHPDYGFTEQQIAQREGVSSKEVKAILAKGVEMFRERIVA